MNCGVPCDAGYSALIDDRNMSSAGKLTEVEFIGTMPCRVVCGVCVIPVPSHHSHTHFYHAIGVDKAGLTYSSRCRS